MKLTRGGKTEVVDAGPGFGYAAELRYFIDCVNKGQKPASGPVSASSTNPTVVTADDAVRSLRLVEAEVKSCRTGETVRL